MKCQSCGQEIRKKKRTNGNIINSINELLGFKTYQEKIKWSYAKKDELLRLENKLKELTKKKHGLS